MNTSMLDYESEYWRDGMQWVAGVDEAGRGPLAGPVVVAAAVFRPEFCIEGVNDSKLLSAAERESFYDQILAEAVAYHVSFIPRDVIDRINILQASLLGMRKCVENLATEPEQILVDGNKLPYPVEDKKFGKKQTAIVKGDSKSFAIAASSILAKVSRDRFMEAQHDKYPVYAFRENKGYPTPEHILLLKENGMCELHRRSFCRKYFLNQLELDLGYGDQ